MKKLKLPLLLSLTISPLSSVYAKQPSLDFVQVGYAQIELDDETSDQSDADGFSFSLNKAFSDSWYGGVSYDIYSTDESERFIINEGTQFEFIEDVATDLDLSATSIGLGYKIDMNETSFVTIEGGYYSLDVDVDGLFSLTYTNPEQGTNFSNRFSNSVSFSGYYADVSYQARVDQFQYGIGVLYRRVSESGITIDDTGLTLEAAYYLTDNFAIRANFESSDTLLSLGVRYDF